MQHYIVIKRGQVLSGLSLGILDDPVQGWQRKARALRNRREQLLRGRLLPRVHKLL